MQTLLEAIHSLSCNPARSWCEPSFVYYHRLLADSLKDQVGLMDLVRLALLKVLVRLVLLDRLVLLEGLDRLVGLVDQPVLED